MLLNRKRFEPRRDARPDRGAAIEILEGRRLLSASAHAAFAAGGGRLGSTIEFSQAPAKVQAGLDALATADGLADPASTQAVYLRNVNGVERYTVDITGTGTTTVLTVNQNGVAVTAPTTSTTTFGALQTSDSAAASEISAIASALSLTAPTSTTTVNVITPSGGTAVYSVKLSRSTSTGKGTTVTVDANGNPVGNQNLPFSVVPSTLQVALTNLAGTTIDPTAIVHVRTLNGVTTYSTTISTGTGTSKTVTVNVSGAAANLPSTTSTTLGALETSDAAAATELQTLATADGYSGTLPASTVVSAYDEANGTTIYSVTIPVSQADSSGTGTYTVNLTLSVDQAGNPTVLPTGREGGGGCGGDGSGWSSGASPSSGSSTSSSATSGSFIYGLALGRHR